MALKACRMSCSLLACPVERDVATMIFGARAKWLAEAPPAQASEWAGNSVPVLLATQARCVEGQMSDLPDLPDTG